MDKFNTKSRILEILENPEQKLVVKARALLILAIELRDVDDLEGYGQVVKAFKHLKPHVFNLPQDFESMYQDTPRILVLKEEYDVAYHDVSTPDAFATVFLSVLKNRLENNYWTDFPSLTGKNNPISAAYLSTVPGPDILATLETKPATEYRDILLEWRKHPTMLTLISHDIPPHMLAQRLQLAVSRSEPDAAIAFLAKALLVYRRYSSFVRSLLENQDAESLSGRIFTSIDAGMDSKAKNVLHMAAQSPLNLRRAGRLAYNLLSERQEQEYEGFEIQDITKPTLDLCAYLEVSAPDTCQSPEI